MASAFDSNALNEFQAQIVAATEEACGVVAREHAGDPVDVVGDALRVELGKRFEPGTGPDASLINQLAERISAG